LTRNKAPIRLILTLSVIIFIAEAFIMLILDVVSQYLHIPDTLADPILLLLFLIPALYIFVFQPMIANIAEKDKALEELKSANRLISEHKNILEKEVKKQTEMLRESLEIQDAINSALRLSIENVQINKLAEKLINIFLKPKLTDDIDGIVFLLRDKDKRYCAKINTGISEDLFNKIDKLCSEVNWEKNIRNLLDDRNLNYKIIPINSKGRIYAYKVLIYKKDYNDNHHLEVYTSTFVKLIGSILQRISDQITLKEEEETLSTVLESTLTAVITADKNGIIQIFNKAASRIFGYANEEIIGQNFKVLLPEPYRSKHDNYLKKYLETVVKNIIGVEHVELIAQRKNGETFPMEISVNETKLGSEHLFVASISDISQRKKNEYQLLLRNFAIDAAANSIIMTDTEGIISYVNSAFLKMTGFSQEDIIGKKTSIFKSGKHDNDFYRNLWLTILNGDIWSGRLINKKKNGELYYEEMTITPVKDESGKIINFIAVKHDVSEEVKHEKRIKEYLDQLEQQKKELEKLNEELKEANISKDKFFSIIAHDLKSPFSALLGYTQIFQEEFDDLSPEEIKEFTDAISTITRNIYQLLLDLLDWARIQTGRMEMTQTDFNLYIIISNIISTLKPVADKKNIEIAFSGDKSFSVFADENMIKMVIRNLISNAIKFTYKSGKINVSLNKDGNKIICCVEDNGIGMSEKDMNKLFKLDVQHTSRGTEEEKGTGLGLILCKEMVERNGGEIWVESRVDVGSKFLFTLPVSNE